MLADVLAYQSQKDDLHAGKEQNRNHHGRPAYLQAGKNQLLDDKGDRRNKGIEACSGDWILEADAEGRLRSRYFADYASDTEGAA